ncbi:unnamed protein product [Ixodes persulcatus]
MYRFYCHCHRTIQSSLFMSDVHFLTSRKRQREYNHFPWVVRALVSAGHVDMCIIFWKKNMQSLKNAKLLKSKHVRGTDSVGAKVQSSLRGARFRKGIVGI